MKSLRERLASWKQDHLLKRVVGNSSYLFASNAIGAVLSIVTAGLLGVKDFGTLGIITNFGSLINRLLSFRMSEVVVKYMSESLEQGNKERAAAVVKVAGLLEAATSVVAFGVLALLAPLEAKYFAKDSSLTWLFILYGTMILANITTETATGVLRVTGHFRSLASINLLQSVLVAGLIVVAMVSGGSLTDVLWAYLIGKAILGLGPILVALYWLPKSLGTDWWHAPFSAMPPRKEFFRFAISTNFSGTINVVARDSEIQWISYFFGPIASGYYKVALALINLIIMPIDPFIATTYPEIARAYVSRQWARLRRLLERVTLISAVWTGAVAVGLLLIGRQVLFSNWNLFGHAFHIYKPDYLPAYPVLLVLLIGYGFANIFFWNRTLLLSEGKADEALWISFFAMLAKTGLALLILPHAHYLAEAFILSGYFVVSIGIQVWRGLSLARRQAILEPDPLPDSQSASPVEPPRAKVRRDWGNMLKSGMTASGVKSWDWLAVVIFTVFAAWFFLGRLEANYPTVILSGDGGNIASYAAAMDHPDWFKTDQVLSDTHDLGVYSTIHIPFIRLLEPLTGDYGLAFTWLVLPETFLQLLGFYILGRLLFKNRFWAFVLAFLTAMMVIDIGLGEIWGVWADALPRVTFQSVLPFLLALVLVWKDRPGRWPWLMVFAGLMVYLHPISAPAWGLAIWLSLWLLQPKDWRWPRRVLVMLGLGGLFLLTLTPYAIKYLSYRSQDASADYSTVMTVLQQYSPANLLNVPAALGTFLWNMTRNLLLPVALAGFVVTWLLKKSDRTPVKVVLLWMAGLFIASVMIPLAEQLVEQHFHILPIETELIRCVRYFVPLLLLFWIWPLVEGPPRLASARVRSAVIGVGLLLCAYWGVIYRPNLSAMLRVVDCSLKGQLICPSNRPIDELLATLRTETQPGEGVFFFNEDTAYVSQSLSVRYAALRPLVYTPRDAGMFSYTNRSALAGWVETTQQVEALRAVTDPQQRLEGLIPLAEDLGASYLVVDFQVAPELLTALPASVMMQNDGFILLKLH